VAKAGGDADVTRAEEQEAGAEARQASPFA
jgi:hypothetical protein